MSRLGVVKGCWGIGVEDGVDTSCLPVRAFGRYLRVETCCAIVIWGISYSTLPNTAGIGTN